MSNALFSWPRFLDAFRLRFGDLFRTWFDDLPEGRIEAGELRISVTNAAFAHYLRSHCIAALNDTAMAQTGMLLTTRIVTPGDSGAILHAGTRYRLTEIPLNPDYTFDQFVVGPSNRLAHASCRAICPEPGKPYNPLFVHGGSGLGKTHLLQAICNEFRSRQPPVRVAYVSCETFVNDFVRAIEVGGLAEFRDDVRSTDVLIIDDIQFLAGRESTQEELFHVFNALHQSQRQIVLSADSPPAEIPTLEERLVSRFAWGLVAQIGPPDRETRHAILQKKARLRGAEIPNDVLDWVAEHVQSNIRALEGALNTLIQQARLSGTPLDVESVAALLPGLEQPPVPPRPIQITEILELVALHFNVRVADLIGRKRSRSHSHPRQTAMYLARQLTPMSLEEIGSYFGGRDHTTVLHAGRTIQSERRHDPALDQAIQYLTRQLQQRR